MHNSANDQRRIWLFAGTGDGPHLTRALLQRGWQVRVSVASQAAAAAYSELAVDSITVGTLSRAAKMTKGLKHRSKFRWVVDATHPFATRISSDLAEVCLSAKQPFLRFERPQEQGSASICLLPNSGALSTAPLKGQRLLLAVGGRHLAAIATAARSAGANLFARSMPTKLGLRSALAAGLLPDHLAVVRPLQGQTPGSIERALCRRWGITAVVCRQSGGVTERLWRRISEEQVLQLILLRRPASLQGVETVVGEAAFFNRIDHG
ncbi:precorrin-6A/cobalt-precorrin-6A reductase [Synechococcus sp. M16CYN]|uniref:precorrin-6A/cobalt-precorrin-6A reductase n=1 Tax=Synechococcus sp. M16CYN TaxID=3103139 RepID=UPI0033422B9A